MWTKAIWQALQAELHCNIKCPMNPYFLFCSIDVVHMAWGGVERISVIFTNYHPVWSTGACASHPSFLLGLKYSRGPAMWVKRIFQAVKGRRKVTIVFNPLMKKGDGRFRPFFNKQQGHRGIRQGWLRARKNHEPKCIANEMNLSIE